MRKIKQIFSFLSLFLLALTLVGCNNDENSGGNGDGGQTPPEEKVLEIKELEVNHNNNNVIYLGDTFTGEGYEVFIVYRVVGGNGETEKVPCENYTIDDTYVDYETIGSYTVTFTARVKSRVLKRSVTIRIADNRLIELGIEHLYGIKAEEYTGNNLKVGQTNFDDVVTAVYLIHTKCEYDASGELIVTETRKRSGYTIDYSKVDTSTPGQYPVYVSFSESYDVSGETITVEVTTFFVVTVEE